MDLTGKKHIVVRIDLESGDTTVEAVGYNGMGCKDATRPFEDALGVAHDRTMKPVTWSQATETAPQHLKLGGAS